MNRRELFGVIYRLATLAILQNDSTIQNQSSEMTKLPKHSLEATRSCSEYDSQMGLNWL